MGFLDIFHIFIILRLITDRIALIEEVKEKSDI
jgi:hypothetical protein